MVDLKCLVSREGVRRGECKRGGGNEENRTELLILGSKKEKERAKSHGYCFTKIGSL